MLVETNLLLDHLNVSHPLVTSKQLEHEAMLKPLNS